MNLFFPGEFIATIQMLIRFFDLTIFTKATDEKIFIAITIICLNNRKLDAFCIYDSQKPVVFI